MRKLISVIVLVLVAATAFAQSRPKDVESIYARTLPIIKIFSHQLGYKIFYQTPRGDLDSFFVPVEWFNQAGGKGNIAFGSGPQYPYMSIYYIDKKFSHIKLFLIESLLSDTWGVLKEPPSQVADLFKVDEPRLKAE